MNKDDNPEGLFEVLEETLDNYLGWLAALAAVVTVFSLDSDSDSEDSPEDAQPSVARRQNIFVKLIFLLLRFVCLIASLAVSTALVIYAIVGTWEWIISPSFGFRFGQSWSNVPLWLLLILWLLTPFTYYLYGFVTQTLWDKMKK